MKYLVDSDYVVDYLKGRETATTLLNTLSPQGLAISIITFAEVYEGVYYGHNPTHNNEIFQLFLKGVSVIGITRPVAKRFAVIRGHLRTMPQGKSLVQPKNTYDILIASTALHYKLILVTRNLADYKHIPQLALYDHSKEAA